jgi:hypothetical protein
MLPAAAIHGIVPCVASTLPVYLLATVYRQTNNVDEHLSFQLVQDSYKRTSVRRNDVQ